MIMDLEMMRAAAPHIGVEPCAGTKTDVMGFPRVVVFIRDEIVGVSDHLD